MHEFYSYLYPYCDINYGKDFIYLLYFIIDVTLK